MPCHMPSIYLHKPAISHVIASEPPAELPELPELAELPELSGLNLSEDDLVVNNFGDPRVSG